MSEFGYFEEISEDRVELERSDIERADLAQLILWWDGLTDTADHIRAQLGARRDAEISDDGWVWRAAQALSYTEMGKHRIRRRMTRTFDHDPNPFGTSIQNLNTKMQTMKAHAAMGIAFIDAAKARLAQPDFDKIMGEAKRVVDAAEQERADRRREPA